MTPGAGMAGPHLAAMLAVVPLFLGTTATARDTHRTHMVVIERMKFGAMPAGLRVGDTLLWVNRDMFRHTATARDKSFNVDLMAGKSGTIVLKRPGTVAFYCTFHPGMQGLLSIAR
ncbi:hypothetical protein [Sphingobium sp. EM0848]|uniref:hypothetical protein n=1 Tax=Sphingobium sp. EM0848 TaxID=2743473 RepID=UPI0021019DD0|nr:hypothetical protein [Sphingobium sp. EM0848]